MAAGAGEAHAIEGTVPYDDEMERKHKKEEGGAQQCEQVIHGFSHGISLGVELKNNLVPGMTR